MTKKTDSQEKTQKPLKGAQIVIKCLEREGVDTIFAYPGGAAIELHQALSESKKIKVILPRHEQGGAFAADGYARATGKTGVCMATSGPGATNLITGIADAYMDSIPVVFITGQVASSLIGRNAFQEIDIIGMTRPVVKHSYLVLDIKDIPLTIAEAFKIANSGRPGPVVVDIPKNVQQQLWIPEFPASLPARVTKDAPTLRDSDIAKIRDAISHSVRPCIYAGGGIITSGASDALRKFAESYNIPVTTTLMGIGAFPETHPLSLKWLGMHGTVYANRAANECDLLLALGARFDDRVTGPVSSFAQGATVVHVDVDLSEINKNVRADIGVLADVKEVLEALNKAPLRKDYAEWFTRIAEWKVQFPLDYKHKSELQPQFVIETLCRLTKGEAVIVPGVGQHQMWAGQFYTYTRPRQFLTSGGLGSMGFGLPAAMGAKVALPGATVVNIDGDGSFQMNIQELGTIHNEDIGVKMIVLNNQLLGMVAQWEDRFYGSNRGNTCLRNHRVARPYPDFVSIAKGYQIPGREVYERSEVEGAIKEMLETKGAFILDCHIKCSEHVLPMIPPGKSYKEIITA